MRKRPVFYYLLFTFLFSWIFWSIPIFMQWGIYPDNPVKSIYGIGVGGPILIATLLSLILWGGKGLKALYWRFSLKGVRLSWYLVALLMPFVLCLTALIVEGLISGKPLELITHYDPITALSALPFLIVYAALEEVGWRGYVLPRLREELTAIPAAVLLGMFWGVWHLPKLLSEGMLDIPSLLFFGAGTVIFSIFISWIYENSRGSISIAVLTHASLNASLAGVPMFKMAYNHLTVVYYAVVIILLTIIIMVYGTKLKKKG